MVNRVMISVLDGLCLPIFRVLCDKDWFVKRVYCSRVIENSRLGLVWLVYLGA